MKKIVLIVGLLAIVGCDKKPNHYLVTCDQKDYNGWELTNFVKKDGYLLSCTYTSPDKTQWYMNTCDNTGCKIVK